MNLLDTDDDSEDFEDNEEYNVPIINVQLQRDDGYIVFLRILIFITILRKRFLNRWMVHC